MPAWHHDRCCTFRQAKFDATRPPRQQHLKIPQESMSLYQILSILRSRWRIAASVFGGIIIPVLLVNLILPKQYVATASVVADIKPDPVAGMAFPAQAL